MSAEAQAAAEAPAGHRLEPLLAPRSVALVGASARAGTPGHSMLALARRSGFRGALFPVNPRYESVEGLRCWPSLAALPEPPDLAVLAVADERLEALLGEAIEAGARAAAIFGGANLAEDAAPPLPGRLAALAREAALPVCGIAGMGFLNLDHPLSVSFALPPYDPVAGGITLLSHSGSSWASLALNDGRLGFNLAVSLGQELTVSAAEYLDYALDLPTTRVVGLVLETVREPDAFLAALAKANARGVPVVALKAGRTRAGARLALSHSGAIAGDDAAYEAVFDRHGVARASTLEELAATLLLHAQGRRLGPGALATTHDSGFERELVADLAADAGTPFASLEPRTAARLESLLDPGLAPINPLDAWGTGRDHERVFTETFAALMDDREVSLGFVCHSPRDGAPISAAWIRTLLEVHRRQPKPVALVTPFPWTRHAEHARTLADAGIAALEGMTPALHAARHVLDWRDFRARGPVAAPPPADEATRTRWQERLAAPGPLDEAEGLALLADYGIDAVAAHVAGSEQAAVDAFHSIGRPVVLKTASPGVLHKSDVGGVRLGLDSEMAFRQAYASLAERLGPRVLVAPMAAPGVEMALGVIVDAQFGPLVLIGSGGTAIELDADRVLALPPFDAAYARRLIGRLRSARRLSGHRGRPAADVDALAEAASRLSRLAVDLGDRLAEIDVNPIVVGERGAVAVDALVVPAGGGR